MFNIVEYMFLYQKVMENKCLDGKEINKLFVQLN